MYKLTQENAVIRTTDNTTVPDDPMNTDWQEYQNWLAAGNTPEPSDEATAIKL